MVGINHIAGGLAITGTICSFTDVNIFSKIEYLIICIVASLLSDIDNTKSILGKILYPISKYISKNYGHRTITHSFLFWLTTTIFVYLIEQITTPYITLIYSIALLSHIILDMMTVQGVPFFYPFSKMIFVIPGDAKMRIQNKNMKSQSTVFVVFIGFIFFSYSLFQNGFWNTYNKTFSKIKHVHNESLRTENLILCKSDKGNGYVIESSESKLLLYADSVGFFEISESQKYKNTTPIITDKKLKIEEKILVNISTDSLNNLLKSKLIKEIQITSNRALSYFLGTEKTTKNIKENYIKNLVFSEKMDTSSTTILENIKLKKIRLAEINKQNEGIKNEYQLRQKKYQELKKQYINSDLEEKEHIYKNLKQAEQDQQKEQKELHSTQILEEEIRYLQTQLQTKQENKITGIVKIINFNL